MDEDEKAEEPNGSSSGREADGVTAKQREQHVRQLADIAHALLQNNLDTVTRRPYQTKLAGSKKYALMPGDDSLGYPVDGRQLSRILHENIATAYNLYTPATVHRQFLRHLEAEVPALVVKGIWDFIEEQPYELIEKLRAMAEKKTYMGKCPVCQDWP
jgi:hypothetical protein